MQQATAGAIWLCFHERNQNAARALGKVCEISSIKVKISLSAAHDQPAQPEYELVLCTYDSHITKFEGLFVDVTLLMTP